MKRLNLLKTITRSAAAVICALTISSCATGGYSLVSDITYDGVDLTQYKTYRTLTSDQVELPKGFNKIDYEAFIAAIGAEMSLRNISYDPNSDLVLEFGMTMDESYTANSSYVGTGYGPYGSSAYYWGAPRYAGWRTAGYMYPTAGVSNTTINKVVDGILIMDMIDTKNEKHVYSSAVKTTIRGDFSKVRDLSELTKATTVLFKKFPIAIPE